MISAEQAQQELLRRLAIKELQKRSLLEFFKGCWEVLEGGRELQLNWHVELLCEYLELVHRGDIKKLLINIAPRHLKSKLVSVAFPCWEWLHNPGLRYLALSYVTSLSIDLNQDRQKIIESDWYQDLSGGMQLSSKKNRMTEFENDSGGVMMARGFDGGVTGAGGERIIIDDPNDPQRSESDTIKESTLAKFKDYTITRRNDPKNTAIIVIQQRTDDLDVSGFVIKTLKDEYEKVILVTEAEKAERIVFPISGRVIERKPGDFLHPERFGEKEAEIAKRTIDEYVWACRFQQNPAPSEGGKFKRTKWNLYTTIPSNFNRIFISVDCTFKATKESDYVVIQVIGQKENVSPLGYPEWDYYYLYQKRDKLDFDATEEAIKETMVLYPTVYKTLIEDKANGSAIITRLLRLYPDIEPINPGQDSKEARASAIVPIHQRGSMLLPCNATGRDHLEALGYERMSISEYWDYYPPDDRSTAKHVPVEQQWKDLIDRFAKFPNVDYDDEIDCTTQLINYAEQFKCDEYIEGSLGAVQAYQTISEWNNPSVGSRRKNRSR